MRVSADAIQLVKVCVTYVLVNHCYACFWMIIHRYYEEDLARTWAVNDGISRWNAEVGKHDVCSGGDVSRCYVRAFHFVITTISSVGYGDIFPGERAKRASLDEDESTSHQLT